MTIHRTRLFLFIFIFLLSACAKQTKSVPPTNSPMPPAAAIILPTETNVPSTETPILAPTQDPTIFGSFGTNEIVAYEIETVANAIFTRTMNDFISEGKIQNYQVISITVFPTGDGTLFAEITYNVRTTDSSWLVDGGTQADDDWINNKCNRFDFVNTETEFQLKNRRTCN